ncbi:uncharacterized protein LOC125208512 isoform X2 [Salvia hispanica]|uniref:uncharacterized protein LOC125208512 isoform X2 n=1 Tax=Salvia hispanica TaxID=49212 RepID=UPI002009B717|nr:uncharacterized protein LOC125208512 isoform X2 [Salvia hispanica]
MAHNILKSFVVILFLSVVVLSPILPTSDAARFTADVLVGGPICPTCVCCTPPPPGLCCKCCSSPIVLSSLETTNGSPVASEAQCVPDLFML